VEAFQLKPQIIIRQENDNFALLYNPDTANTFVLDPVSLFVCQHLNGSLSLPQIIQSCREIFSDIPPDALDQVKHFVQTLVDRELVDRIA
jgi:hypothetical protein